MALAIVADPAAAEEVTLDVFVRAWRSAASYRPDQARVSTWLVRIARNHAIDTWRRRRARPADSISTGAASTTDRLPLAWPTVAELTVGPSAVSAC